MKFLILTSLLLITSASIGQDIETAKQLFKSNQDSAISLLKEIAKDGIIEDRVTANYVIGKTLVKEGKSTESFTYLQKAIEESVLDGDNTKTAGAYIWYGSALYNIKAYSRALQAYRQAGRHSDKYDDYVEYHLGLIHQRYHQFDSAVYYLKGAYHKCIESNNSGLLLDIICELGHAYFHSNNFEKAIEWYQDLYDIAAEKNNETYIGYALNNIGNALTGLKEYDEAIDYLEKALPYKSQQTILTTYLNLAEAYQDKGDSRKSISYFKKAIESESSDINDSDKISALKQIVNEYQALGITDSAIYYATISANEAYEIAQEHDSYTVQADIFTLEIEELKQDLQKEKEDKREKIAWILGIAAFIILLTSGIYFFSKSDTGLKWRLKVSDRYNKELKKTLRQQRDFLKGG